MTIRSLMFIALASTLLASCEGLIRFSGHVYDGNTRRPLGGVKVGTRHKDGIHWLVRREYDTVSTEKRKQLRQHGVKDNYTDYLTGKPDGDTQIATRDSMQHYVEAYTDSNGRYTAGPWFVGMVFGPPNIEFVFYKQGYDTVFVKTKSKKFRDSIILYRSQE